MEKTTTIFSLLVTLLFMQWNNSPVDGADISEAKVTGAIQKTDNPMIAVVENEDAKSGWAVKVQEAISEEESTDGLFIYLSTRTDPKAEFKISFANNLCYVLQTNEKFFLPEQIVDMIFPMQKGSCEFKVSERAIRASAQVNTKSEDELASLPMTPFELEARLLTYSQAFDYSDDNYIFKVNFNVGGDINKK